MTALRAAKKELRAFMRQPIARVSPESIAEQSTTVAENLLSMPAYHRASRIGIYLSMQRCEILTRTIVKNAIAQGKQVFVPYICDVPLKKGEEGTRKVMEMVALSSISDFKRCEANRDDWGIPSVKENTVPERHKILDDEANMVWKISLHGAKVPGISNGWLDMVIMPGVAFDGDLARLGHGKGFYEHFLQSYYESKVSASDVQMMPFLVGLALKEQMVPPDKAIPLNEYDWKIDTLIVGDGTII